jgi:CheY-like chemotaxis protein
MASLLVVDDDPLICESLSMLLSMKGYQVNAAANGLEALQLLRTCESPPRMIVLDLMMPVMDGLEFRRHQLADPGLADIPVIIVTAKTNLEGLEEAKAVKVIRKPYRPIDLLAIIEAHCGR